MSVILGDALQEEISMGGVAISQFTQGKLLNQLHIANREVETFLDALARLLLLSRDNILIPEMITIL